METIKINNTTLEYNKIIYVDAINGSDEVGDGSKNNPYKTLQIAIDNSSKDNAIYLKSGTYTIRAMHNIFDCKYVDIIGEGYNSNIIIEGNINSYGQYLNGNIINNFYSLRFSISKNYDSNATDTHYLYIIGTNSSKTTTYNFGIYNCIFEDKYGILSTYFFAFDGTDNFDVSIDKLEIINSSFYSIKDIPIFGINATQSIVDKIQAVNIVTSSSKISPQVSNSFYANLKNASFDEDYNITSEGWQNTGTGLNPDGTQSHIGVYGGEFAWNYILNKYLIQDNNLIKKPIIEGLEEIGTAPVTKEMFDSHGTEDLSEIIGIVNKDVDMIYKEDLEDRKIYGYKLVGYSDISKLEVK